MLALPALQVGTLEFSTSIQSAVQRSFGITKALNLLSCLGLSLLVIPNLTLQPSPPRLTVAQVMPPNKHRHELTVSLAGHMWPCVTKTNTVKFS